MQTSYTMTEHGEGANPKLSIYCFTETCQGRAFKVAHDWDPESGSQDATLAYKGTREKVLKDAWEDYLRNDVFRSRYKMARNVISYLLEDPEAPPFVPSGDGAFDTTRKDGDGTLEVWEEEGTIHDLKVRAVYHIDPDEYTDEQREQAEFDWDPVLYRIVK